MTTDTKLEEKTAIKVTVPSLWKVVFLNDDKTPMEFVIQLLTEIFKHDDVSAQEITLEIHETGSGIAGIYTHEIAEQRGIESTQIARNNGFPLKIVIEPDQ